VRPLDGAAVAALLAHPSPGSGLSLPAPETPEVSVIILAHSAAVHTVQCLSAVATMGADACFEVIVVDDGRSDETAAVLARCAGVRVARSERNLGFTAACRAGAALARGRFLHFLGS